MNKDIYSTSEQEKFSASSEHFVMKDFFAQKQLTLFSTKLQGGHGPG